jgi:hypothetical protein
MGKVRVLGDGTGGGEKRRERIYQSELDTYIGFENNIQRMKRAKAELARSIMERLERGAELESGPHDAIVKAKWEDGAHIRKLKVR